MSYTPVIPRMVLLGLVFLAGPLLAQTGGPGQGGTAQKNASQSSASQNGASQGRSAAATIDPELLRGAALVYGPRHALALRSPKGWQMDVESGKAQGLQTVFYPNGERWAKSPAVMYCLVVPRNQQLPDLRTMMDQEQQRFRNSSPGALVVDQDPLALAGRATRAVIRRFSGGPNGAFEQVAYVEERTVMVMMVLSCRTSDAFNGALPAFSEFVGSYRFLADDAENIQRALEAVEDLEWEEGK